MNKSRFLMASRTALCLAVVTAILQSADAQAGGIYTLNWNTIAGGAGTGNGGNFSLNGTVGQPAAGPLVGPNCSLASGFWATEYVVVQTPGAPWLTLTRSGRNVILSWPSSVSGFSLKSSTDLSAKASWTTVSQSASLVGGQYQVTLPANQPKQFFRLGNN
jgi:hypothetical protein